VFRDLPKVTQAKINALLEELRTWPPGEVRGTLVDLAARHELDVFVVDRLTRSEGLKVPLGEVSEEVLFGSRDEDAPPDTDPNATTLDLDPDEIDRALGVPDPSPDWAEDKDTGIWRKKPTGEWELVSSKSDED
jgi:hypothetical protein